MKVFDARILRVNLSNRKSSFEDFSPRYRGFLGGRGVNQYILFREMAVGLPVYHPSTPLMIGAGLLCGTGAPGAYRTSLDSKNAFTGGIGSANVGTEFCPALRKAGVADMMIVGRAEGLSMLIVDNGRVEIKAVPHLKMKTVPETYEAVRRDLGEDFHVLAIGPAGENVVRASCVVADNARVAGRSGIGAIMGSKNLKAIAVRGDRIIEVEDPGKFEKAVERSVEKFRTSEFARMRAKYGVYCVEFPWGIESPYRNFSGMMIPESKTRRLSREEFYKYLVRKHEECDACPLKCWTLHEFEEDGERVGVESLQLNSLHNFGAKLDMDDPKDIMKAHKLCNDLGLDEDVTSNAIAWAIELYEDGLIDERETGGLKLRWGDGEVIMDLIRMIARKEGFGAILGDGCKRASESLGKGGEYCIHIKGNDLFECLWSSPTWALGVVVAPRGGTHTRGATLEDRMQKISGELSMKLFGVPTIGDIEEYGNKEKIVVFMERLNSALDSLGICFFMHSDTVEMMLPEDYAALVSAATGMDVDAAKLLYLGERIYTVEKSFNVLHRGWTRVDDMPPRRFVERPLAGKYHIDIDEWNRLLDRYYEMHGWDEATGWPKKETLMKLDLTDVYEKLKEYGKML